MAEILVGTIRVSFLDRDAALVSDHELELIEDIVDAEKDALYDGENLKAIEFIDSDVSLPSVRYNTVSERTARLEDV